MQPPRREGRHCIAHVNRQDRDAVAVDPSAAAESAVCAMWTQQHHQAVQVAAVHGRDGGDGVVGNAAVRASAKHDSALQHTAV